MKETLNFIMENWVEITMGAGTILAIIFNKPKTAEKTKKVLEKKLAKLKNKEENLTCKCAENLKKQLETEKELKKYD